MIIMNQYMIISMTYDDINISMNQYNYLNYNDLINYNSKYIHLSHFQNTKFKIQLIYEQIKYVVYIL